MYCFVHHQSSMQSNISITFCPDAKKLNILGHVIISRFSVLLITCSVAVSVVFQLEKLVFILAALYEMKQLHNVRYSYKRTNFQATYQQASKNHCQTHKNSLWFCLTNDIIMMVGPISLDDKYVQCSS